MEEIHTFTNTFAWKYICGFFNLNIYFSTFQAGCQELFTVFFITRKQENKLCRNLTADLTGSIFQSKLSVNKTPPFLYEADTPSVYNECED